jgi:hypothetical protein
MGRPAVTSLIVKEEHSVLKFGMGGGIISMSNSNQELLIANKQQATLHNFFTNSLLFFIHVKGCTVTIELNNANVYILRLMLSAGYCYQKARDPK